MGDHGPGFEPDLDEGSIVARAQDGDLAAFEHLVLTYQSRLFRLAYRMLNDRGEAEDIVQETLTTSWRGLPMLADVDAFGGWIYRLATNKCLDLLRKRSAHAEHMHPTRRTWTPSREPAPAQCRPVRIRPTRLNGPPNRMV